MTKELALYTANLASQMKNFDKHLYNVLVKCYEMYDEAMILASICTLLIKGSRTEHIYFHWYEKAVDAELKIAQLYEYYMAAARPEEFHKQLHVRYICILCMEILWIIRNAHFVCKSDHL